MAKAKRFGIHRALLGAAVAVAVTPATADQRETIVWALNNFKPYVLVDGPDKGQGIFDKAREAIARRLPGMSHESMVLMTTRVLEMVKVQPNICSNALLKTPEREKLMEFTTLPTMRILPTGVITTRDRLGDFKPYLNGNGELRLDDALAGGKLRVGLDRTRSFGVNIDAILKAPSAQPAIVTLASTASLGSKLLKMASQKEYELTIGYAIELRFTLGKLDLKEEDFAYLPIEGETTLLTVPVACAKGDFGRKTVAAIDKILADPEVQREMTGFYRSWLDAETAQHYDRALKQAVAATATGK